MDRREKVTWAGAIVGVLSLPLLTVYVAFSECDSMCGNHIVREYRSPNGRTKLTVFERDCGATTDFSTQASVLPAQTTLPHDSGNVLAIDSNHGEVAPGEGGGPALGVRWVSDTQLVLYYCEGARVFRAEPKHESINIAYERSCPSPER